MFNLYAESTKRVLFHARYYAYRQGSKEITMEHLLLGLMRESPEIFKNIEDLKSRFNESTSIENPDGLTDIPLSMDAISVLKNIKPTVVHYEIIEPENLLNSLLEINDR